MYYKKDLANLLDNKVHVLVELDVIIEGIDIEGDTNAIVNVL